MDEALRIRATPDTGTLSAITRILRLWQEWRLSCRLGPDAETVVGRHTGARC